VEVKVFEVTETKRGREVGHLLPVGRIGCAPARPTVAHQRRKPGIRGSARVSTRSCWPSSAAARARWKCSVARTGCEFHPVSQGPEQARRPCLFPELVAASSSPATDVFPRAADEGWRRRASSFHRPPLRALAPPSFPLRNVRRGVQFVCSPKWLGRAGASARRRRSPFEEGARLEWVSRTKALAPLRERR